MVEDAQNILKNIRQTKEIFRAISRLIQDIDEKMCKKGWTAALKKRGKTCISEVSKSIESPDNWLPTEIFRFYKNNSYKNLLVYVSVLIDNDKDGWYTIEQPLITAGFFDYGKNKRVNDNWYYYYACIYGYIMNEKTNDKPISMHEEIECEKDGKLPYLFRSGKCFGLPLVSIKDESDIEKKIVKPLLQLTQGK